MSRAARVVVITLAALLLGTPGAGGAADARRPRVTIYGDSLAVEAGPYLERAARQQHVVLKVEAYPGTAPCDYVPVLAADLASRPPDVAVFAFSGNSFVTCMLDLAGQPLTGDAIVAKYRTDVAAAVAAAARAGRPLVLASPPIARGREAEWLQLDTYYRELAATQSAVHYLDAGTHIAPRGQFALKQPCLRVETTMRATASQCRSTRSRITVRSADGLHFCGRPPEPAPLRCPKYASGARRYADNLVRGAKRALNRS
jgi:hypothetical protein